MPTARCTGAMGGSESGAADQDSGVTQVHAGLPWREKWHKARNRDVWDDSAIVRIDFSS